MLIRKMLAFVLLLLCAPALAAETCYRAEAAGSSVTFHVLQAGAPYDGRFRQFSGEVCFKQGQLTRIDAVLDPASVDTGLPELDAALKERDFFAVPEYPRVSFVSSAAQSKGNNHTVHGTLEIKGHRREIVLTLRTQQQGNKVMISGTLTLDRLQYGIGTGEWANTKWLGAEVRLDIRALLSRK